MRFFTNNNNTWDRFEGICSGFGNSYFSWGGILVMFIGIAVVALIVYLVVKNNRNTTHADVSIPFVETKKDTEYYVRILKESYAKGNLSDEEFERKVRILRDNE